MRPSKRQDYSAVASIYNQAIATGGMTFHEQELSAGYIQRWVEGFCDRESLLVLVYNDQILGWGVVKRYSDRTGYRFCCETSIYLDSAETGKGYGSILQKALLQKAVELNYHHVVLKIVASNQGSIRFHEQFGFETVGIQEEIGFTHGRWHDVAIMQLILPAH
ncbi:GNAT family N-acetyltransferase [Acaryochloris thomasi]|uniref:GNAT family N-acetyltransferase n=1 Tax=Acaryochloris thomasi TaxID=2929456 RepID=UPI001F2C49A9|nr:GNAT family N-acetyltransferase [Acaryochloris thomasi]